MNAARTLYVVATGAPLTRRVPDAIPAARERGWQPAVIATSAALSWLDRERLDSLDVPVLTDQRGPGESKRLPAPDAVILAPATFNTLNKLATGIADSYAMGVLCEALSTNTPIVVVPFVGTRLTGHPAWLASLAVLRYAGATLIDPRDGTVNSHQPLESGTGDAVTDGFQWAWPIDQLDP